ncbi:hypothetical protein PYW07_015180 [Mythimna separata]|uniref:BTB domain-containing protein n=1 Tax=Mythimna separata TaxID=271217 RepID=A0AAD7YYE8_MYTSE|nr:hypothetical protein PYW07_015180 [Mythimna separata]
MKQDTYVFGSQCNPPYIGMETDEDVGRGNMLDNMPPISCDVLEGEVGTGSNEIGDLTFCMGNYISDFMKMMFTMRSHHMLTDVVLEVGNELFHVHKVVLAAGSPYFKAMFTSGLKECEMSRVRLQGVCPSAIAWLVYFLYTGKIRITEITVCQLLPAATMFQISNVIDACCAFLERQLDPSNAIGIANFAEQHGCVDLKKKAHHFIERHFTQVCQEEEFLQLTPQELICMIRKDELNVREEREVYNAVLSWVKYDEDRRHPRMEHILQAVRCQYLTPSFLKEQMSTCTVLKKVPACREYLAKIFKDLTLHKKPVVKERRPNTPRIIYVAGGYFRHSIDLFEAFNLDDNCWTTLPRLTVPRSGLGAAFLKVSLDRIIIIYVAGGYFRHSIDLFEAFNLDDNCWTTLPRLTVPRSGLGAAFLKVSLDRIIIIYVAGGYFRHSIDLFEAFNLDDNCWTTLPRLTVPRSGLGAAFLKVSLDRIIIIYVAGGYFRHSIDLFEAFNLDDNCWTTLPRLTVPRSGLGAAFLKVSLDGIIIIYVAGGYFRHSIDLFEAFNLDDNCWTTLPRLTVPRSGLGAAFLKVSLDGIIIIYVAGGYFRHSIDLFEAFNLDDNCWTTLPRLTVPRSGLGAAFLKGLFYAVGGRNTSPGSSYDSDWVDVYNPATEHWRPCSPMSTPRHRVGVAVMDGLLYAVGGSAGSEYHKSVECYDPERDTWTSVASMGCARLGVGVAVVNRLLYAVGGFDGARRIASVECYHPENNIWNEVAPMHIARSGAGVAAMSQYIYVVGGYDGSQQLASVERYDTERDAWELVAPVHIARSALSLTVLDNKLYALGGYDGTSFLDIVEVYDPASNTWSSGTALTSVRSGHASAVCYQHVAPHSDVQEPIPTIIKKLGKRPAAPGSSVSGTASGSNISRNDDIPTANNIIGTLSNPRTPSDYM